jgi:hypothetical protein
MEGQLSVLNITSSRETTHSLQWNSSCSHSGRLACGHVTEKRLSQRRANRDMSVSRRIDNPTSAWFAVVCPTRLSPNMRGSAGAPALRTGRMITRDWAGAAEIPAGCVTGRKAGGKQEQEEAGAHEGIEPERASSFVFNLLPRRWSLFFCFHSLLRLACLRVYF